MESGCTIPPKNRRWLATAVWNSPDIPHPIVAALIRSAVRQGQSVTAGAVVLAAVVAVLAAVQIRRLAC